MKEDQASMTAVMVAYSILVLAGDAYGRSQLPADIVAYQVQVLAAAGCFFGRYPWLICNPIVAKVVRFLSWLFGTGYVDCLGFRKLLIDQQVREFVRQRNNNNNNNNNNGKTATTTKQPQVVVVAAGFDVLALRLSREYPHVHFFEVDHPATSRVKQNCYTTDKNDDVVKPLKATTGLGEQPANVTHVQADLTVTRLDQVLSDHELYDVSAPTAFVVEGLSMYLTEEQLRGLFHDISQVGGKGSMAVFDFFDWNEERQDVETGMLNILHRYGFTGAAEPWIFGMKPEKAGDFFVDTNWKLVDRVQSCSYENVATIELC